MFLLQVGVFEASGVVREAYLQGVVDDLLACAALTDGRYVANCTNLMDGLQSVSAHAGLLAVLLRQLRGVSRSF